MVYIEHDHISTNLTERSRSVANPATIILISERG